MQSNSQSQPTPRVGNLSRPRRTVIPDITGASQLIAQVGNLSRCRHNIVSDTVGSGQLRPRVGNLNRDIREVVCANRGSGSGTQLDQSSRSHSTPPNCPLSSRNSSLPLIGGVQGRLSKRPRRSTIQTRENTEPETEPDGQGHIVLGIPRMPTHKTHAQTPAYQSIKTDTSRSSLR